MQDEYWIPGSRTKYENLDERHKEIRRRICGDHELLNLPKFRWIKDKEEKRKRYLAHKKAKEYANRMKRKPTPAELGFWYLFYQNFPHCIPLRKQLTVVEKGSRVEGGSKELFSLENEL